MVCLHDAPSAMFPLANGLAAAWIDGDQPKEFTTDGWTGGYPSYFNVQMWALQPLLHLD